MARYLGPVCRLCRRERTKLYLKGAKCDTLKCPMERRPFPPGMHGRERTRQGSEYLLQLREKQKAKRVFGVLEKQFRLYYKRAAAKPGIAGENLIKLLELRLDSVVYRVGWASSRKQARQFVRHGHILVNGQKVTIPSYSLKVGDKIELSEHARNFIVIRHNKEIINRQPPPWIEVLSPGYVAQIRTEPLREHSDVPVREQLIVELYSK
jgi:small subunit ribosomal protein S4